MRARGSACSRSPRRRRRRARPRGGRAVCHPLRPRRGVRGPAARVEAPNRSGREPARPEGRAGSRPAGARWRHREAAARTARSSASGSSGCSASSTTTGDASAPPTRRRSTSSPVRARIGQWMREAGLPGRYERRPSISEGTCACRHRRRAACRRPCGCAPRLRRARPARRRQARSAAAPARAAPRSPGPLRPRAAAGP